jgi:hypothetical protein
MTENVPVDAQAVLDSVGKLILRLKNDLAEADVLDRNSVSDPTDKGRCAAMHALSAVIQFLDVIVCEEDGLDRPETMIAG